MSKVLVGTPDEGQEKIRQSRLQWVAETFKLQLARTPIQIRKAMRCE